MIPKMTKEEIAIQRYESAIDEVNKQRDPFFKVPDGFLIPLRNSVVIKKQGNTEAVTTEAGIMIPDTISNNSVIPNIGIIYAVGPNADPLLSPGLKVSYNHYADLEVMVKGQVYHLIHDHDVHGIMPEKSFARLDPKSDEEVAREHRIGRQEAFHEKKAILDANQLDKITERKKKK